MDGAKEHNADSSADERLDVAFDETLALSPDTPLDPKSLPALGGVYLLADESNAPIFLGVCENLRRVVPPRLAMDHPDEKSRRANLGEIARRISWKRTRGAFEGLLWHWQFARQQFPDRYADMLGFGPCWFVRVDPQAEFPRFEPVGVLRDDSARYFGPIPRRKDAESLIRLLEDAFDLCRYHDVLLRSPLGERCAYFDMGRCPAPCDGTVGMSVSHEAVREALAFLESPDETTMNPIRRRMKSAADRLAFESAAAYKRVIEDAKSLRRYGAFAQFADAAAAVWIVIIRAGVKRTKKDETQLKAFCLTRGRIRELTTGPAREIESLSQGWRDSARASSQAPGQSDARATTESMRLLSRFLFKEQQRDTLIYELNRMPPADTIRDDLSLLLDTKRRY